VTRLLLYACFAACLFAADAGSARAQAPAAGAPAFALHYGARPPIDELQAFDVVVLEPDHVPDVAALPARHTAWFAYVSVVETAPSRRYAADIPKDWLRGDNPAWGSRLVDQTAPGWAEFFETRVVAPLWQRGWRGFFLDTLDSYHLFARTAEARRAQEDALVALIQRLRARFPGIRLVFNRGFEILPRLKGHAFAVAAESLYRGYDRAADAYRDVPAADRDWLLGQLARVQSEHGVPVVSIEYVPPGQRAAAREAALRVRAHGFVPYVADGALAALGLGDVEVVPRRVALITDRLPGTDFQLSTAHRLLAMPLHYLGYTIDLFDVKDALPEHLRDGTYAAIVTWFSQPVASLNSRYAGWLKRHVDAGLGDGAPRLVLLNQPGLDADAPVLRQLGFARAGAPVPPLAATTQDGLVGFETRATLDPREFGVPPLRAGAGATPLLRLRDARGATFDTVGVAPWGGYALQPHAFVTRAFDGSMRWVVNPIEFLWRALGAPAHPVPDVTTEGGRRLLLVHIDGDGFPTRAEVPGSPFASDVLVREILQRYRVPTTLSVIQGEIAGNGLFKELAPALEEIARRAFALPHVELASHSLSHPFNWGALASAAADETLRSRGREHALSLVLPGYRFNLKDEIAGSVEYIDTRLAPPARAGQPAKRTRVFLWTGDTMPTREAVELADASGLLNMNGGDTLITRSQPTLTLVEGLGLRRGRGFQVYAPNQNENVYTNNWLGPFYGFERVIETFQLTEAPYRLKPVNIYYHTYSASKRASLEALHRVYRWALAQPVVPVYASDYIRKVLDFDSMVVARDWRPAPRGAGTLDAPAWRVRGQGEVRTLRLRPAFVASAGPAAGAAGTAGAAGAAAGAPAVGMVALNFAASSNVAGARAAPPGHVPTTYVHVTAPAATIVVGTPAAAENDTSVYVHEANGWIGDFRRHAAGITFTLISYHAPAFVLARAEGCRVRIDGADADGGTARRGAQDAHDRRAQRDGARAGPASDTAVPPALARGMVRHELAHTETAAAPARHLVDVRCR
jgi:hypothetical protein